MGRRHQRLGRLVGSRGLSAGNQSRERNHLDSECTRRQRRDVENRGSPAMIWALVHARFGTICSPSKIPTRTAMLAVQLDDRALFLERWRSLLLELLDEEALRRTKRGEFRDLVETTWTGSRQRRFAGVPPRSRYRSFAFERTDGRLTSQCERERRGIQYLQDPTGGGPAAAADNRTTATPRGSEHRLLARGTARARRLNHLVLREGTGGTLKDQTWGARNVSDATSLK